MQTEFIADQRKSLTKDYISLFENRRTKKFGIFNKEIVETYILPAMKEACERSINLCNFHADCGDAAGVDYEYLEQSILKVKKLIK